MAGAPERVMLRTVSLKKHFGGVQAVGGVDLSVPPGDVRAIIGPNGAGKTTLFNLITGDLAHDSGAIYFDEQEVSGLRPHQLTRRGMGRTFQITSIFRRLTAFENVQTAFLTHHRRHYNVLARAKSLYRDETFATLERVGLREHMDVVFAVAKRITVMHQGLVLAEGAPAEVRANADVQRVYLGNPEPSR